MCGHAILAAVIDELSNARSMRNAIRVMLSGCSAAALALYMHADRIRGNYLLDVLEFEAVPSAGLFLWQESLAGTHVYENHMRAVHQLHHLVTHCGCAEAHPDDEAACMSAEVLMPHISTPMFIVDSLFDQWQLQNVLGYVDCANGPSECTQEEID